MRPASATPAVSLAQPPDPFNGTITPTANADTQGMFSASQAWPIVPIHSALMPNGKVVSYGTPVNKAEQNGTQYDTWTPSSGFQGASHSQSAVFSVNSFCSIGKLAGDGTFFVVGGNTQFAASNFNSDNGSLTGNVNSLVQPRWYASMVRMPDDRMVVVGGGAPYALNTYSNNPPESAIGSTPEVFRPGVGWSQLTGAKDVTLYGSDLVRWWYPRAYVAPDGNIFGISREKLWKLNPTGAGSVSQVGTITTSNVGASTASVMFSPGKILLAGGGERWNGDSGVRGSTTASVIDINAGAPSVRTVGSMTYGRNWLNLTTLANGDVLSTGGTGIDVAGSSAVYASETWNPATETWRTGASSAKIRTYHSTSLLMPNGFVLTGGSGVPAPTDNFDNEVYFPSYLFTRSGNTVTWADRDEIRSIDGTIAYGGQIALGMKDARNVAGVAIQSLGAVTHSQDADSRRIPLQFTQTGSTLNVSIPSDKNTVVPGWYMLHAVDANGVPSPSQIIEIRSDGAAGRVTIYGQGYATPTAITPPTTTTTTTTTVAPTTTTTVAPTTTRPATTTTTVAPTTTTTVAPTTTRPPATTTTTVAPTTTRPPATTTTLPAPTTTVAPTTTRPPGTTTTTIPVPPNPTLVVPSLPRANQPFTVTARGFSAGRRVELVVNNAVIASATVDAAGNAAWSITANFGYYTVSVRQDGKDYATRSFWVWF